MPDSRTMQCCRLASICFLRTLTRSLVQNVFFISQLREHFFGNENPEAPEEKFLKPKKTSMCQTLLTDYKTDRIKMYASLLRGVYRRGDLKESFDLERFISWAAYDSFDLEHFITWAAYESFDLERFITWAAFGLMSSQTPFLSYPFPMVSWVLDSVEDTRFNVSMIGPALRPWIDGFSDSEHDSEHDPTFTDFLIMWISVKVGLKVVDRICFEVHRMYSDRLRLS